MTWHTRTPLSVHSAADIFCFKVMQWLCSSRVSICILHIRLVNPPGHPQTPCGDEVRRPPAYFTHQHPRRGSRAVLPVVSSSPKACVLPGDTDRVLQPHHRKARTEKEGSCVGVAVNVEEERILLILTRCVRLSSEKSACAKVRPVRPVRKCEQRQGRGRKCAEREERARVGSVSQ